MCQAEVSVAGYDAIEEGMEHLPFSYVNVTSGKGYGQTYNDISDFDVKGANHLMMLGKC